MRAADDDVTDAVRAGEVHQSLDRVLRLDPHPLGAEFAGLRDVVEQMPLRLGVDEVGRLPGEFLLFLDDNLLGDPRRAIPILEGLVPMGKRWVTQTTLHFAEDLELLALMRRSGCMGVFVGVEGLSCGLAGLPKLRARLPMAELVRRVQGAGILVEVSMIFGFDDHGPEVFEEAVGFVKECAPSGATFHILTPYPGTRLFRQFEEEGRLLHRKWHRYNHSQVVFLPRRMSPGELYAGWVGARSAAYAWPSILSRVARNPHHRLANLAYNVFRRAPNVRLGDETASSGP